MRHHHAILPTRNSNHGARHGAAPSPQRPTTFFTTIITSLAVSVTPTTTHTKHDACQASFILRLSITRARRYRRPTHSYPCQAFMIMIMKSTQPYNHATARNCYNNTITCHLELASCLRIHNCNCRDRAHGMATHDHDQSDVT